VLEAIDGRLPAWSELSVRAARGAAASLGWPAPEQPEHAIDDAEYDLAQIALTRRPGGRSAQTGALWYLLQENPHLARALRFRARRWLAKYVAADGFVVTDERARQALVTYLQQHEYSPSTLELLASCPYRYYLRAIARLSELDQPAPVGTLDARERGVMFHKLLNGTLEQLAPGLDRGAAPLDPQRAAQALDTALSGLRAERADKSDAARARLLDVELTSLRHDLWGWLEDACRADAWRPRATELPFGERRAQRSVKLANGMRLAGAIDLVEQSADSADPEQPVLRVTDFKTGRARDVEPQSRGTITAGGHVLQPLLYALALERLYPQARVTGGQLCYCTRRERYATHAVELNERTRGIAAQVTESANELLTQGFLPAAPEQDACAQCEYLVICGPHDAERERVKQRDSGRLRSLQLLRRLP
jgi:CRISPR/Cas system-associated exonuclease Cas4 (RecB family)